MLFKITPAAIEDIPQLVSLVNSAYRGEASKKGWTTEADLLDGIRTDEASLYIIMNKPSAVILKYLNENNEITGCVYLEANNDELYLGMLSVAPQSQAQGIGKQLMKASEEYAQQHGLKAVVMTVISVRTELIKWYERHGYKQTGHLKPFPDDNKAGVPKKPLQFVVLKKLLKQRI
jgi:ribosomal protein S18 acetylase RimI-like enzyme